MSPVPDRGLLLFRASRLEDLLAPLDILLAAVPPASMLAPQTVLVGHPGLRGWVLQQLAARRGPGGIVGNLDIALPSPWLDDLAHRLAGEAPTAASPWQRDVLRWRVWALLDELDDERVRARLSADSDGAERFALAERIAAALAPLMLYRTDWLTAWDERRSAVEGDGLLRAVWALLRRADPSSLHRGERLAALARRLRSAEPGRLDAEVGSDPLHLFGVSHLPPSELDAIRALARHRPVVLHVLDPCRDDWLGLGNGRDALRVALEAPDLGETGFLALDHPLLAGWGRLGQHFLLALEDSDVQLDVRSGRDLIETTAACERGAGAATQGKTRDDAALLGRLQRSLLLNDPTLLGEPQSSPAEEPQADASLRVHRAATPLRELEVLRDALADAFANIKGLQPADVVVMAPDMARFRDLIPAVFGEPGRYDSAWPWYLADVPLASSHPLLRGLLQALALPGERLGAEGLLALLDVPAVARRFKMDAGDAGTLRHTLHRLGVAWAFDGADRARFGLPEEPMHSFSWGMDRALSGHVFGDREPQPRGLPDGARLLPAAGVDAGAAELLGKAFALLLELRQWAALGAKPRRAADWALTLRRRIDALFERSGMDESSQAALDAALAAVAALDAEWAAAAIDEPLPWPAVRDALLQALEAVPEAQRLLRGGITFCGMVPQRAIPFRVVAVLGLDEGALPRHVPDDGFDLRRRWPRRGDRDLASDDRYLFLETLVAARDRLHLSYVGAGVDDGRPRNPALPLADLLATLERFAGRSGLEAPPWLHDAPLQPAALLRALRQTDTSARVPAALAPLAEAETGPTDIEALAAFFRTPARSILESGAGVRLDAMNDDRLADDEPLLPRSERRDGAAKKLALAALEQGESSAPAAPPESVWLGGTLAPGTLGEAQWAEDANAANRVLGAVPGDLPMPLPPLTSLSISLPLQARLVTGEVPVRQAPDGALWLVELVTGDKASAHFGYRAPLLLRWLALRLSQPACTSVRVCLQVGAKPDALAGQVERLDAQWLGASAAERELLRAGHAARLQGLVDFRDAVLRGERRYSPKTSQVSLAGDDSKAQAAWDGGGQTAGERNYAPGWSALLGRDWRFESDGAELAKLREDAAALSALLDPQSARDDA